MGIIFDDNWDGTGVQGYPNHDSNRSQDEVRRLINEIPTRAPNSLLTTYIQMGWDVHVEKGIHQRQSDQYGHTTGAHIRVYVPGRTERFHINLQPGNRVGNSFIWEVSDVS